MAEQTITAETWLAGKTHQDNVRRRAASFAAIPAAIAKNPIYVNGSNVIHLLARDQCSAVTAQILDKEFTALARFIAPVISISERLAIIDGYAAAASGELYQAWQDICHATSGRSLNRDDRAWIETELEKRAVKLAEPPNKPLSAAPEDRATARAARWESLQSWLKRTGTQPTAVLRVLSLSAGIHGGRVGLWLSGEMNLNSRERFKLAALIGATPEEIL